MYFNFICQICINNLFNIFNSNFKSTSFIIGSLNFINLFIYKKIVIPHSLQVIVKFIYKF